MTPLRRNVLIFHLGALGDFILTWPLAMALARLHPQSRIIYVTHKQKGALAERALRVESTDIEAGWHHLFSSADALPPPAAKLLSGAHSIYTFIAKDGDVWTSEARRAAPHADLCCLDPRPPADSTTHVTDHLLAQLSPRKAIAEGVRQMVLSLRNQGLALARSAPASTTLAVHPGSGGRDKCWPPERFLDLTRQLRAANTPVRILLGEVERDRWPKQTLHAFRDLAEVVEPPTLLDLLKSLSDCARYLGHDTGPTHLAASLGLPTLALFGPTAPSTWHPLGPHVRILHKHPLASLTVDEVLAALPSLQSSSQSAPATRTDEDD